MDLIHNIRLIFDNYGVGTEILAASVRHNQHLLSCALAGADVVSMPFSVIAGMIKHPLIDSGLEKFLADHAKANK